VRGRSFFVSDDLLQAFDAVTREGRHAVLANAIDPKAAILREHVARKVEEPVFVRAEQVGDVADREGGADGHQDQATR
jgi:hypothetical protein